MTHREHIGDIWVEDNMFTGSGHYITPSEYLDKPFHIKRFCPKCKKEQEFEYEPNPLDKKYHCIICDSVIDMRLKRNKLNSIAKKEK